MMRPVDGERAHAILIVRRERRTHMTFGIPALGVSAAGVGLAAGALVLALLALSITVLVIADARSAR
jgi:hypothetical protein